MRSALLLASMLGLAACQHTEPASTHAEPAPAGSASVASPLCEQIRPRAEKETRDDLATTDRGKHASAADREAAVHAFADLMIAQCTADKWSATQVECMITTDGDHCGLSHEDNRRFNKAVDAAWDKILGPDPDHDALEKFGREQAELAKQKEAARAKALADTPLLVDAGVRPD